MDDKIMIVIANDYSKTPGPRYKEEGKHPGEEFREVCLIPKLSSAIREQKKLLIDLDGTAGYGTSFLEESFGGLVRINNYRAVQLLDILEFKSNEEPYLIDDIKQYISEADYEKYEKQT